jgi:serine protease SohB
MEILWSTVDFASKGLVVFTVFLACSMAVFMLFVRRRRPQDGVIRLRKLNDQLKRTFEIVGRTVLGSKGFRRLRRKRTPGKPKGERTRVFVLEFRGDIAASAVHSLRQEITALLQVAGDKDEVVVRLESAGGLVPHYGLAASQLARLKGRVRLTVCIDKVAASGGYMMACVADEILAAPFAIVGSIGVAAPVPNVHRWLQEHGVDYQEMTAGEYKRTVSFLGEITEEGRRKYQEQIDETHALFKSFIHEYRPELDIDAVATGEYWHGTRARELGLVHRLVASDDYILEKIESADVYAMSIWTPRPWRERLANTASLAAEKLLLRLWTRAESLRFQ